MRFITPSINRVKKSRYFQFFFPPRKRRTRIILHIGRHKSGTSSLQQFLSQQTQLLKNNGIIYPLTGRKGVAHHPLSAMFSQVGSPVDETVLQDLENEIADYQIAVISSENFQNIHNIHALRQWLRHYNVQVVCYLREAVDYMVSAYAQRIHATSEFCDFESYVAGRLPDIGHFLDCWAPAFPTQFRLFDRASLVNGDVLDDFNHVAELGLDLKGVERSSSNTSIFGSLLYFKLLLNLNGLAGKTFYHALSEMAQIEPRFAQKFFVSQHTQDRIRATPYNALVEEATGQKVILKDFTQYPPMLDRAALEADLKTIGEFEPLREFHKRILQVMKQGQ